MKRLARIPGLKLWTMLLLLAGSFGSCDVLEEEYEDCATYVSFKYDMNMLNADAFSTNVKSVTLYVFKDGKFVFQKTEEGELLSREGYRMRLDEIPRRQKHEYDYIIWAGLADNVNFAVPLLQPGDSKETLTCRLNREHVSRAGEMAIVKSNLQALFHGQVEGASISRAAVSDAEIQIPLTKNTNTIRIILQHYSAAPLDKEQFEFTITDKNGLMNYDNSLLEDEQITYYAWDTRQGSFDMNGNVTESTNLNMVVADLSVARLMADEEPELVVTNKKTGDITLRFPLIDMAKLLKGNYVDYPQFGYAMSDQEYLDREDTYTMVFVLDHGLRWTNSVLYINSWRVVLQNSDLN